MDIQMNVAALLERYMAGRISQAYFFEALNKLDLALFGVGITVTLNGTSDWHVNIAPPLQVLPSKPAGAVPIPEALPTPAFREDQPERFGYVRGWNACRKAMIAYGDAREAAAVKQSLTTQGEGGEAVAVVGERGSVSWRSETILPVGTWLYTRPSPVADVEALLRSENPDRKDFTVAEALSIADKHEAAYQYVPSVSRTLAAEVRRLTGGQADA